ncbi:MAG: SDR family oxidoreductase [Gammaproteobacteria bacterium]|nr:SDR family oxidoreductase [Gammaproteobacteria bacterium]MCP4090108.1 SDR family oxidoreductase [Gammaproteobacteria bacterium]MCP4277002.1 SDR family oxidoreductase [Gammaproteobacteria bacterium]MCP4832775.1 SDR family oxidoreductase [Gammaproteobacteria bacterium]MCP4929968.1 SDR family oxidoreductase [Gammaproteobacteria bacterium]
MDLKDKVIVITGAARGLGAAMAQRFASHGSKLALVDLDTDSIADTVSACNKSAAEVRAYGANVADEGQVVTLFEQIVTDFGGLDGLINNAGITRDALLVKFKDGKLVTKMSLDQWQAVIDVNLTGVFLCGREAAQHMIQLSNKGVIVNISSISRAGNIGQGNYAATKAGVHAMTVTWAKELARYGIRTGSVAPGFINTEMVASMKPEAREKLTSGIPIKRMGEPDEIANAVEFIFGNDYFSGRIIEVDGVLRL